MPRSPAGTRWRLLAAQVCASLALPAGATSSGLLAVEIAGPAAAALPLAVLVAGSGVAAVAAGPVAARAGRRASLLGTYTAAIVGALLTVVAAVGSSLALLLVASRLFGAGNAAAMLTRYAAADGAPAGQRGRELSWMLLALTVGAIVVPNLLGPTAALAGALKLPGPTGLFLLATPALLFTVALLPALPGPTPVRPTSLRPTLTPDRPRRRLSRPHGAPLLVLAAANLAMVTVMAVFPPLLHAHGTSLNHVGLLVSAHVAAMYAPAPLAGRAVDRYGAPAVAVAATGLMVAAALLGLPSAAAMHAPYAAAVLVLIGAAWSGQVVAASTWLTDSLPEHKRTRAEGLGEAGMAIAATAGGLAAAPLLTVGGTPAVLAIIIAATLTAGTAAVLSVRRSRRTQDFDA